MQNKSILLPAFILISLFAIAGPGDTTFVKTFTFDSINSRRATFTFPDEQSWEKILMYYTIKCDAATPWDSYPCGEWDYTTYTNVYEHTGELDSVTYTHPLYTLNNYSFETFAGCNSPKYHKTEKSYVKTTPSYSNLIWHFTSSADDIGNFGLNQSNNDSKIYLLYDAAMLATAGITSGDINAISILNSYPTNFYQYSIVKIAHTSATEISEEIVRNTVFTEVYSGISNFSPLNFNTIFNYDGTSGLIIEISTSQNFYDIQPYIKNKSVASTLYTNAKDFYFDFENYSYVEIPAEAIPSLNNEITISMWAYGDPDLQPQNDMLLEAYDNNNQRQLCIHYPWSNGNIYWDAGNTGSGYDRIDKAATASEYEGKWNHIAFTKNTVTGSMKIYINGVLWHSGTGKTNPIQNINKFILGCAGNKDQNYSYDGYIDDFCVWDKELSAAEIQEIMYTKPDASFSAWDNLLVYYDFDENPGSGNTLIDYSGNLQNAKIYGTLNRKSYRGENRFKNFTSGNFVPAIEIRGGEFTSVDETIIYMDSVLMNQQIICEFYNPDIYSVEFLNSQTYYNNYELTTDINSNTDTTWFTPDITINNVNLTYYGHSFEVINTIQIQNYVTPYGIGLNIGTDGFTHVYDVSDYVHYLKNSVDISAHNTQELIDVTFAFIEGTPARNVLQFDQVYLGNFGHYNIANNISLTPKKIKRNPSAEMFSVKTRTTGHGMAGDGNCSEFCPTWHNLSVEGTQRYQWYNWTSCAGNPIFPQGGTWIFDRAGWCPGSFANTYDWDITEFVTDPDSIEIDYGMTQYEVGNGEGNYNVSTQLIQYSAPNFVNDVAIENIVAPSNADLYKRYNPVCQHPEIIIKNNGSEQLNSVLIEYGLNGDYSFNYQWTGELDFLESASVILPVIPWQDFITYNNFNVRVSNPNNVEDQYEFNNQANSQFNTVDIYPDPIVLVVRTNNYGDQTHYTLTDHDGNVLVNRDGLTANTMYYDTLDYGPGCYDFRLYDRGEDGLDFWYWEGTDGTGYAKIRKIGAGYIKNFPSDFGSFIHYQFVIPDASYIINTELDRAYFEIFPNPNNGNFKIKLDSEPEPDMTISIRDMSGRLVKKLVPQNFNNLETEINLEGLSKGFYLISLDCGRIHKTKKLVVE